MKNMNDKTKKWLTVTGCLAACAVLVVLIGAQFKTEKPVDAPLPNSSSPVSDVTVTPPAAEKEKDVVVTPPEIPASSQPTDNGAVSSGTDQTIQVDPVKPEYTEEQLKDATQKPTGDKVTPQDKPVDHDKVEQPKDTTPSTPKPSGSNSIPGFDNVPDGGANTVIEVDGDGDINKQVGSMD